MGKRWFRDDEGAMGRWWRDGLEIMGCDGEMVKRWFRDDEGAMGR